MHTYKLYVPGKWLIFIILGLQTCVFAAMAVWGLVAPERGGPPVLLTPFFILFPALLWYQALSVQMLPERLRAGFGFDVDARDQRAADRALTWIRRAYPLLPARLRYVGPYHEAQARLQGRPQLDLATRCLNRAWIGRPRLE